MINPKEFADAFAGHTITRCLVHSPKCFYFLTNEANTYDFTGNQNVVSCRYSEESAEWEWIHHNFYGGWGASILGFSPAEPMVIVAAENGKIFSAGGGSAGDEYSTSNKLRKMREIDGELYVCGPCRTVGFRYGINDWRWRSEDIPLSEEDRKHNTKIGFNDIDGFSEKDIYAVGGNNNDVWHYNGSVWKKLNFPIPPTSNSLSLVCCGGDGRVYVARDSAGVYCGRENQWELIPLETGGKGVSFRDMAWHDGRLWITGRWYQQDSDSIWCIENGRFVEADIPDPMKGYGGCLSTRDGVLLVAGGKGAAYLENGQWNDLFNYKEMQKISEKENLLLTKTTNVTNIINVKSKPKKTKKGRPNYEYSFGDKEKEYFTKAPKSEYIKKTLKGKRISSYSDREVAEIILNDPDLSEINSLIIGMFWDQWESMQDVLDVFVENKEKLQHIESLYFGRYSDDIDCVPNYGGDFSELWAALPHLRALVFWGGDELSLGDNIDHKELRYLEIISCSLPDDVLKQLSEANLPALETLIIYTNEISAEGIEPLLSKKRFPALKTLGLVNSYHQGEVAMVVMDSDILPQLEKLYLCYGTGLDDEAGQYILNCTDRFESLKHLHMPFNNFSNDVMMELLKLPFEVDLSLPQADWVWDYPLLNDEVLHELEQDELDWFGESPDCIFGLWR